MIFPFVDAALDECDGQVNPTLQMFLKTLKRLRVIILQDVSAMIYGGFDHILFTLPVFKTHQFQEFSSELHQAMMASHDLDPAFLSIKTIIPMVCEKMDTNQKMLTSQIKEINNGIGKNMKSLCQIDKNIDNVVTSCYFFISRTEFN
jgi:hypothetical protein